MTAAPEIYRFGVPLVKSYTTTERGAKHYILEGVASDQSPDQQGDTLIQQGLNYQPLLESGMINWDHMETPDMIIGEPVSAEIQPGPCFFVRGELYADEVPQAQYAWKLAEAMSKAGRRRRLGWSVQGEINLRDGKRILRSTCTQLALTHQPVNANTVAQIAKSLNSWGALVKSMSTVGMAPTMVENLDPQITSVLWGDCQPDRSCYHGDTGYFYGGRGGMLEHLVKCKGMQVQSAATLIKRLIDSGI